MTPVYIIFNSADHSIKGIYTNREVAVKMRQVERINKHDVYVMSTYITEKVPEWAERVLALEDK